MSKELVLINQFFRCKANALRTVEIEKVLRFNVANTHFSKYICLTESKEDREYVLELLKPLPSHVEVINFNKRISFNDIFLLATIRADLHERVWILGNADIYFDETVTYLGRLTEAEAAVITRHNVKQDGSIVLEQYPFCTQDVWSFVAPPPGYLLTEQSKVLQGNWGCENRIAYEIATAGLAVYNPCVQVRCLHLHLVEENTRPDGSCRVYGNYLYVRESEIPGTTTPVKERNMPHLMPKFVPAGTKFE